MTRMTTEQLVSVQGGGFFDGFLCGAGIVALIAVATGSGGAALGPASLFFAQAGVLGACLSAFR